MYAVDLRYNGTVSPSTQDSALNIKDPQCTFVLWINQSMSLFYKSKRLSSGEEESWSQF